VPIPRCRPEPRYSAGSPAIRNFAARTLSRASVTLKTSPSKPLAMIADDSSQLAYFQPSLRTHAPSGPYQVIRRLPESGGEFHYVIRSTYEDHERVAKESELTRV
jgi:hypothetical protein